MAIRKIKSSKSEDEKLEEDTKVKTVVEKIANCLRTLSCTGISFFVSLLRLQSNLL